MGKRLAREKHSGIWFDLDCLLEATSIINVSVWMMRKELQKFSPLPILGIFDIMNDLLFQTKRVEVILFSTSILWNLQVSFHPPHPPQPQITCHLPARLDFSEAFRQPVGNGCIQGLQNSVGLLSKVNPSSSANVLILKIIKTSMLWWLILCVHWLD